MAAFDARFMARRLIGGMDIRAFNDEVRERRAARFEAAIDAEQVGQLFDLARLESLFASDAIPLAYVDIFDDGHLKRLVDMQKKSGKTGLAMMADRFCGGSTIRVRDVDRFDMRLGQFASEVRRHFAAQSQVNVYVTPPTKAGFPPHFDITDVFIVQCLGRKEWRVFHDYAGRIDLPLVDTNWDPDRFRPSGTPDSITLSAGDVLYLPRGLMHQASCTDRASMHLTISIAPLTFADLISRELQRVAARNIQFRQRVPWSVDDEDGAGERIAELAQKCLFELSKQFDVSALLRAERRSLREDGIETGSSTDLTSALIGLFECQVGQPSTPSERGNETR